MKVGFARWCLAHLRCPGHSMSWVVASEILLPAHMGGRRPYDEAAIKVNLVRMFAPTMRRTEVLKCANVDLMGRLFSSVVMKCG